MRQHPLFFFWRNLLAITTLTMAYFAAGWLGTRLSYSPDSITLIWPSAGIALAAGVLFGYPLWPGVVLGEMLVLLANRLPASVSCSVAVGNALAMLAGLWLLEKANFDKHLERVRDVVALAALGGFMATLVSASVGVAAMALSGVVAWSVAVSTWFKWWLGDAMGVLLITPVLLTCCAQKKAEPQSPLMLNSITAFLALAITGGVSFGDWLGAGYLQLTLTFLPFSCLVWIALHRGVHGSALAVLIITVIAVSGTVLGFGPFIRPNVNDSLALLWGFLTTTGLTALLLSAVLAERRQVEAALRESEQEFRTLFELSTVGVAEAQPTSGRFVRVNQTFCQIVGYLAEELLCKTFVEITHPDDRERDQENFSQALERGGMGWSIEKRYRHKTGRVVWVQVSGTILRDTTGRPYRTLASILDITERQQAEQALRESEERFRLAMDATSDGLWEWNIPTGLTYYSPAYFQMLGYKPEGFANTYYIWVDLIHPDDREHALAVTQDCIENRRETFQVEFRMRAKSGEWRWILARGKAVKREASGRALLLVGTHVDITARKQTEKALVENTRFINQVLDTFPNLIWVKDAQGRLLLTNQAVADLTGKTKEELLHQPCLEVYPNPKEVSEYLKVDREVIRTGRVIAQEESCTKPNGEVMWVYTIKAPLRQTDNTVSVLGIATDITERKRAEEALFEAKERAQVTLHSIGDAVITTDAHAVVDYLNPVAEALTGWTTTEAQGRPLSEVFRIVNEQSRQPAPDPVVRCLQEGKIIGLANHSVLIGRHGQEYHVDDSVAPMHGRDGQVLGAVLVFHDVTETRQLTRQLEYDATHDALTGLINRPEFERRLERALASAQQYGASHALCYLDLDHFKIVNDTAGHVAGDALLKQINTILAGLFRERDTLARIGGDEFALLLNNCPLDRAQLIAQVAVSTLRDYRFQWADRTYQIGVSIGLVPITAKAQDTAQLLTQADVACYIAKELGRNRVHLYQHEDSETALRHGEILGAAGLRDTLEQGRFRLHYQPIIPLATPDSRPVCYEALLRVVSKSGPDEPSELVMPAAFIPAAERYGLMGAVDRWVIQATLRAYAAGIGKTGAMIAINLSGNSLSDETLLDFIEALFAEHGFPPERVCFEITETAAIQNLHRAAKLMTALKRHGSQFALDDFGSGLSSFHYLKTLPVDYLKIDGSFVKDMIDQASDCALVAAINQMSHTLGIQTVAEYAHSRAVAERLRELGVDYAQGYFFGQPMPWADPSLLGKWS
jgi:diguanylate cyclase (GGDEF)-like protein/PAS domain S-box-containing protein